MPTKLVCFTRSTPDIHRLSTVYCSGVAGYTIDEHNKLIKKMVHEDVRLMRDEMMCAVTMIYVAICVSSSQLNKVYLCKLSSVLSERAFKGHLQTFAERIEKKIMILVCFCKYLSVVLNGLTDMLWIL